MKKVISTLLVCVLLVGTLFTLVSCGKSVTGTYECVITDSNRISYEFGLFGKVTRTTTAGALGFTKDTVEEGKYVINETGDNEYEIVFTWETEEGKDTETQPFSEVEKNGVKYITIGILEFEKVK